jgi:hypothetical protein
MSSKSCYINVSPPFEIDFKIFQAIEIPGYKGAQIKNVEKFTQSENQIKHAPIINNNSFNYPL